MPRIKIDDLPVIEELSQEAMKGIFGGEPIDLRIKEGGDLYREPQPREGKLPTETSLGINQPYLAINWVIALKGIYPPRDQEE